MNEIRNFTETSASFELGWSVKHIEFEFEFIFLTYQRSIYVYIVDMNEENVICHFFLVECCEYQVQFV
ncbi:hypothetical protein NY2A_b156R [Paramecium bursaria Chlorella virus NY2A]|uniref:Uncharacterized protein b156R n=1 Tax=Paramecium bursaria Chlorella virus NY2A TaxID=46021 RepID=A7IW31_PBCVN|nr:hypothetical protein NY2A_b156R [Paramecium bursaria Chlorella virus NY2A]ABT14555.1 hypothetical protein NY2A_b156R [Paramecium bursaria Chlorella virus NY2A]